MATVRAGEHNIDSLRMVDAILDRLRPRVDNGSYTAQISLLADRSCHERRDVIGLGRIGEELGLSQRAFEFGIGKTVRWYLDNEAWWRPLIAAEAAERRGVA